jgi:hypothetical protein
MPVVRRSRMRLQEPGGRRRGSATWLTARRGSELHHEGNHAGSGRGRENLRGHGDLANCTVAATEPKRSAEASGAEPARCLDNCILASTNSDEQAERALSSKIVNDDPILRRAGWSGMGGRQLRRPGFDLTTATYLKSRGGR